MDAVGRRGPGHAGALSVGYGVAYPFAIIGVVLLVQLLRRLGRAEASTEEERWLAELALARPELEMRTFLVTNPACAGRSLASLDPHRASAANVTRLRRDAQVTMMTSGFPLALGDVVMATGTAEDLLELGGILGEETQVSMDLNRDIVSVTVDVTNARLASRTLRDLEVRQRHGVVITSQRRQGVTLAPDGGARLELGDTLDVVGERGAVRRFVELVNPGGGRPDQTSMLSFLLGLALGVAIGTLPIPLPGGVSVKLEAAGGVFLVSLVLGHLGRVGPLLLYAPQAATNFARELGLLLFLAGAGTTAGTRFVAVLRSHGVRLLLMGATVTLITVASTLVALRLSRLRLPTLGGALSACMTNSAALEAACAGARTDLAMLAYASAYPVALIFKVVGVQLLVELLGRGL